jgi:hypothetical protein
VLWSWPNGRKGRGRSVKVGVITFLVFSSYK